MRDLSYHVSNVINSSLTITFLDLRSLPEATFMHAGRLVYDIPVDQLLSQVHYRRGHCVIEMHYVTTQSCTHADIRPIST